MAHYEGCNCIRCEGKALSQAQNYKPKSSLKERLAKQRQENYAASDRAFEVAQERRAAQKAYDLAELEWNKDLQKAAKEYQWDTSQQENISIGVFTIEEANEYLDLLLKDTHGQLSAGKDYAGVATGVKGAYEVAKELGGLGATAKAVSINGVLNVVVENYKPRYLDLGIRWQTATPKMLRIGYALNTIEGNINFLRGNIFVEVVFSGAVNSVDYMLHDEKTLGEVVGQFSADAIKGIVAGAIAQGFTLMARGLVIAFGFTPPTSVLLGFFAFAVYLVGSEISTMDNEYEYTKPMKEAMEKAVDGEIDAS